MKILVNCVGCGEVVSKYDCEKVYRGQKNYGFCCPKCLAEARKKSYTRSASNKATDKSKAKYYTLKMNIKRANNDIKGWLEGLGYAIKCDNFNNIEVIGAEVQGFQSITKVLASYNKRFTEPMKFAVTCNDKVNPIIVVDNLEDVRLFSQYKGYDKLIKKLS